MKKSYMYLTGFLTGIANGLFGAGGGLISVELLSHKNVEQQKAHAMSIALTLSLSIVSTIIYFFKDNINLTLSLKFIPFGIAGAITGSIILKKISPVILQKIFCVVMIISGIRMFCK